MNARWRVWTTGMSLVALGLAIPAFGQGKDKPKQEEKPLPVTIEVDKKSPALSEALFDPLKPPAGAPSGANAYTDCRAILSCGVLGSGQKKDLERGGCEITWTVTGLAVKKLLKIVQYMPSKPPDDASADEKSKWATLKAHEDAHVELCNQVFKLVSDKLIGDAFAKFPKSLVFTVEDCSTNEKTEAGLKKARGDAVKPYCDNAAKAIDEQMKAAGAAYDQATGNGTIGPKKGGKPGETEPATPENQAEAGKEAFKDFKKSFEKK